MNMKKSTPHILFFFLVASLCVSLNAGAQDIHFSQFYETPLLRNPALAATAPMAPSAQANPQAPGTAPQMPSAADSQEARLSELLLLYKNDQITPTEYQARRAKILSGQ